MPVPALRRPLLLRDNTITLPRSVRDAIPDQELSAGRVLMLDRVDADASHTEVRGRRVHLRLRAQETGKLTGAFDVVADLDLEAAQGLVALLQSAIDQAQRQWPASDTARSTSKGSHERPLRASPFPNPEIISVERAPSPVPFSPAVVARSPGVRPDPRRS